MVAWGVVVAVESAKEKLKASLPVVLDEGEVAAVEVPDPLFEIGTQFSAEKSSMSTTNTVSK